MHQHHQPWLKPPSLDTLIKAAAVIVGFGIVWGDMNARLAVIEGEAPERKATRERIASMDTDIAVTKSQAIDTNARVQKLEQWFERYIIEGSD